MNIIFSDVDGTFQEIGLDVPQINVQAIHALQERGDRFVFVTGRGYDLVQHMSAELEIDCDVIFGNGAGLKEIGQYERYTSTLNRLDVRNILKTLDDYQLLYFVHTDQGVFIRPLANYTEQLVALEKRLHEVSPQGEQIMAYKIDYFENSCTHVDNIGTYLVDHPEIQIVKIEMMDGNDEKLTKVRQIFEKEPWFVFQSFVQTLEIVHPQSTKGSAIKRYLQKYPNATTYGIGDGENDLTMLQAVDVPVAVANATDQVKELSKVIAPACADGGVGRFIFENILVEERV